MSQDSAPKEDFALTNSIQILIQVKSLDHFDYSLLPVHNVFRKDIGSEDLITLTEFLEWNAIWKSLKKDLTKCADSPVLSNLNKIEDGLSRNCTSQKYTNVSNNTGS